MNVCKTFVALLVLALAPVDLFAANPPSSRGNLIHTNSPFVRVGGDKVIFGFKVTDGCNDATLRAVAIQLKNRGTTDRWDDQWYAFKVNPGACLMMGWYNLSQSKFGWAAIQNKPNSWGVRSNYRGWEDIGNGVQKKYSYKINGQQVDLDIFNPRNENGLTGNDILISFGF